MKKHNYKSIFLTGLFAGLIVGIAGMTYLILLSFDKKVLGSVVFSIALLSIAAKGLYLYTGKIGYVAIEGFQYLKVIGVTLLSNAIGLAIVAGLAAVVNPMVGGDISLVSFASDVITKKMSLTSPLSDLPLNLLKSFILAIFCGMLMYLAVDGWNKVSNEVAKVLLVVLAVIVFILAGFEHSIANLFYLFLSGLIFTSKIGISLLFILVMLLGNAVGGMALAKLEQFNTKVSLVKLEGEEDEKVDKDN